MTETKDDPAGGEGSGKHATKLSTAERQEIQMNKGKHKRSERDDSCGISDEEDGEACRKKLRLSKDQSAISVTSSQSLFTNKAPPSRCWMVVPTLSSHRLNLHQLLLA
ncbi:hypothetical protein ACFXTO_034228 [Malus domestica]